MKNVEVVENMPFEKYLKLDRLSASSLKNFQKTPAYYMQKKKQPHNETEAMKLGTFVHTWMLENTTFNNYYYRVPNIPAFDLPKPIKPYLDIRKKEVKDLPETLEYKKELAAYNFAKEEHGKIEQTYLESAGDRIVFPEEIWDRYTKLPVRNDTKNEVTVLWEWHGVPCKSRFDMLHVNEDEPFGVEDLKTISNIFNIDRDFYKFGYHLQAGFYAQAFFFAFGKWPEFFNFTFVSTAKDYMDMSTNPISFEYLEIGRMKCEELVLKYKECKDNNTWKGVSGYEIEAPSWI